MTNSDINIIYLYFDHDRVGYSIISNGGTNIIIGNRKIPEILKKHSKIENFLIELLKFSSYSSMILHNSKKFQSELSHEQITKKEYSPGIITHISYDDGNLSKQSEYFIKSIELAKKSFYYATSDKPLRVYSIIAEPVNQIEPGKISNAVIFFASVDPYNMLRSIYATNESKIEKNLIQEDIEIIKSISVEDGNKNNLIKRQIIYFNIVQKICMLLSRVCAVIKSYLQMSRTNNFMKIYLNQGGEEALIKELLRKPENLKRLFDLPKDENEFIKF